MEKECKQLIIYLFYFFINLLLDKENPKTRFGFQEGDEIIVEVDLADRIITYENKRTKNKYT